MTPYRFGDIVVADVAYSNLLKVKRRPAVVVSVSLYHQWKPDVLLASITSKLAPIEAVGEFAVLHWQQAGLDKPSAVKAVITTTDHAILGNIVGRLSDLDKSSLAAMVALLMGDR